MARPKSREAGGELEAGSRVGADFRLETPLGRSPSGQTWLARRISDGSHVAIKVAHRAVARDPELRARFAREAKIAQEVECDHVVQSAGFGVSDGAPYLVLEYLEGETLRARLEREGPQPTTWVVDVARQIASALEAAHAAKVVHHALRPENVFLVEAEEPTVKVLDFGLAEPKRDDGPPRPHTCPEQLRGEPVDDRSDVWAWTAIVYEALSGSPPFTEPGMRDRILTGNPARITAVTPGLPPGLDAFFARAFAPAPEDRFGTAAETHEAFLAAIERRPRSWSDDLLLFAVVAAGTALGALAASSSWP